MKRFAASLALFLAASAAGGGDGLLRLQATEQEPYQGMMLEFLRVQNNNSTLFTDTIPWINIFGVAGNNGYYPDNGTVADTTNNGDTMACNVASNSSPDGATEVGTWMIPDAETGFGWYITGVDIDAEREGAFMLFDVLWADGFYWCDINDVVSPCNLVLGSTENYPVSMATLPPRDLYGTTNGDGVFLFRAAFTSGSVSANSQITVEYTNSAGTTGRTGTHTIPNGAENGNAMIRFIPMAAGDHGIQAVTKITINVEDSGAGENQRLFLARPLGLFPAALHGNEHDLGVAKAGSGFTKMSPVRIYNGTCLWVIQKTTISTDQAGNHDTYGRIWIKQLPL